jgi:catechol 2,3-dioxygenase-like lactoylglutathione lyase family enzyme
MTAMLHCAHRVCHAAREGRRLIHALDHVVIAVRDLDAGIAAYRKLLGRPPGWRGEAGGDGTATAGFPLANVTAELIAPAGDGPGADRLRAVLDTQGEGLASLAFAVDDVEGAHRRLARLGLDPEPVTAGESADAATGARRRWRRTRAATAATHGVRMFLIERDAPVPVPPPAAPDGVSGLDHVVIRTPDPERAAALYGARLGLDMRLDRSNPAWGARLMFFRCGDLIVELAHDLAAGVSAGPDHLWGLSWRTASPAATRGRLRGAGVGVSDLRPGRKPGTQVFTVRDGTCGVPTLMLQPSEPPASREGLRRPEA